MRKLITNSELNLEVHDLFAKLLEEPLAKCRSLPNHRLFIIDALDETEYGSRKDFLNVIKVYFPSYQTGLCSFCFFVFVFVFFLKLFICVTL